MTPIINSTVVVSSVFIAELIFKQPRNYMKYIIIFLLTLGGSYAIEACATHVYEEESLYSESYDELDDQWGMSNDVKLISKLRDVTRYELACAIFQHNYDGNICLMCVEGFNWFGNKQDKDMAQHLYATLISGLSPGEPQYKIAAMLLYNLGILGIDMINKYHQLNSIICEAQYHYEMFVFYQEIYRQKYGSPYVLSEYYPSPGEFPRIRGYVE